MREQIIIENAEENEEKKESYPDIYHKILVCVIYEDMLK